MPSAPRAWCIGLLLLDAAVRAARELAGGYFGDVFHWPILPEALVPPKAAYAAVLVAEAVLAAMVVVGLRARWALLASALLGTYVLLCDRVQFHNNRWALACYSMLLALTPCDRAAPREGPLWAARLAPGAGRAHLCGVGWVEAPRPGLAQRSSACRADRRCTARRPSAAGVPQGVLDWLSQPGVARALATLAIATELLLSVGLWPRRTRAFALWWGVWFHLTIEATSRVESFTWLTLAMYALFATPDARARKLVYDGARPRERALARAVVALDWLARFDVQPRPPGSAGSGVVVVGRDGREAIGLRAFAAAARCLPLLFPLWVPLQLGANLRETQRRRDAET